MSCSYCNTTRQDIEEGENDENAPEWKKKLAISRKEKKLKLEQEKREQEKRDQKKREKESLAEDEPEGVDGFQDLMEDPLMDDDFWGKKKKKGGSAAGRQRSGLWFVRRYVAEFL